MGPPSVRQSGDREIPAAATSFLTVSWSGSTRYPGVSKPLQNQCLPVRIDEWQPPSSRRAHIITTGSHRGAQLGGPGRSWFHTHHFLFRLEHLTARLLLMFPVPGPSFVLTHATLSVTPAVLVNMYCTTPALPPTILHFLPLAMDSSFFFPARLLVAHLLALLV